MKKTFKIYIISTLLASVIFGIIVFSIMSGYNKGINVFNQDDVLQVAVANNEIKQLEGESTNIAVILSDENNNFFSIVLLRIDKERGQSSITVFPKDTLIKNQLNNKTLEHIENIEGGSGLLEFIHAYCGITVDKYILLKGEKNIRKAADVIGALYINIPSTIVYGDVSFEKGENNISPTLIYPVLAKNTYSLTDKTKLQYNLYTALFKKLLSGDPTVLSNKLKEIINLADKTNITYFNIDHNIEILTHYSLFTNVDGMLCEKPRPVDILDYFEVDIEATIKKFLPYRRLYQ